MRVHHKSLSDQVVVITGASSGIGLATARAAARRGAKVVLASRNEAALADAAHDIQQRGGEARAVVTDVSSASSVEALAAEALAAYGRFDTWVNNAGVGIFGRLEQVSDEDHRRLFDVNFWGVVYGTRVAAAHLKRHGGAIVNLGSIASDLAFPVQGMYCASKHAIKGFTDAFRMELMEQAAPVSLTLIKPAAINTPFPNRAANYLDQEPKLPPPIYAPEDVAGAILYAAEHGGRDYYIGGGGKLLSSLNKHLPSAVDWIGARSAGLESGGPPIRPRRGSLHEVSAEEQVHGRQGAMARRSLYTGAQTHPAAAMLLAGLGVGIALLARSRQS